jgi:hypothetical protein
MSDVYHVYLKHSRKIGFCARIGYRYISMNFPLMSSFISFYPTQGHPTEAYNIHLDAYPKTWIKERCNKNPHSKCILVPLHALFSTTQTSYSSSILNIKYLQNVFLLKTHCLP